MELAAVTGLERAGLAGDPSRQRRWLVANQEPAAAGHPDPENPTDIGFGAVRGHLHPYFQGIRLEQNARFT